MRRESLEVYQELWRYELRLYHTLTIWGDQIATYGARETVGQRRYKLIVQVREFPLTSTPETIAATYWWAGDQLRTLEVPPGNSQADQQILRQISERWLELSNEQAH